MPIKTIENREDGKKWEIFRSPDNSYFYKYYEFFNQCGWKLTDEDKNYTKEAIEWEFDIVL